MHKKSRTAVIYYLSVLALTILEISSCSGGSGSCSHEPTPWKWRERKRSVHRTWAFSVKTDMYQQKYNLPAVLTLLSTQASPPALLACAILEINLSYARSVLKSVWGVFCWARSIWLQWYNAAAKSSEHRQDQFLPYVSLPGRDLLKKVWIQKHLEPRLAGVCTDDQAREAQTGQGEKQRDEALWDYSTNRLMEDGDSQSLRDDNWHVLLCPLTPIWHCFPLPYPHQPMDSLCLKQGWPTLGFDGDEPYNSTSW